MGRLYAFCLELIPVIELFFFFLYEAVMERRPLLLLPFIGPLNQPLMMTVEQLMDWRSEEEIEVLSENLPQFRCPAQIPHVLTQHPAQATAVP
jgi:hypothetical protein